MSITLRSTSLSAPFSSSPRSRTSETVRILPSYPASSTYIYRRPSHTVHILSGDLILHKRTLGPVQTVIYGLRRYDVDRCAALVDTTDPNESVKVVGYMSHKSKIYLADVYDHMEHIMTSLDMYTAMSENLINYTFNVGSPSHCFASRLMVRSDRWHRMR